MPPPITTARLCGPKGCATLRVMLDTGADRSILSRRTARALGIAANGAERVNTAGGAANHRLADAAVAICGAPKPTRVWVDDRVPRSTGVDAVIGNDVMERDGMLLDMGRRRIRCPR